MTINTKVSPINFTARFTEAEMTAIYEHADAKYAMDKLLEQDLIDLRGEHEHHHFMSMACLVIGNERMHQILRLG